jgi:predicted AAA+ superfamily ATPase
MLAKFIELSETAIEFIDCQIIRPQIAWLKQNERLIGIKGSRGVGKTTLLLQFAKTELQNQNRLYISLDNPYFAKNDLFAFVDEFVKNGGKYLLLDEVHHYNNWSLALKNLYDSFKSLKIIFTGSSLLHLTKGRADLSRRSVIYTLPGLSLREFINFTEKTDFPTYKLSEIIENHQNISKTILAKVKPIQKYNQYNLKGYYPFFLENNENYLHKLLEIVNQILEADLPFVANISYSNIKKLKQLLQLIAESVPFKPNLEKISAQVEISKNTLKDYLYYLQEALLIFLLKSDKIGDSRLSKPEKIYLFHPNLMHCITSDNINIGNIRESFFINQLQALHKVSYSAKGDFLIDGKMIFEIGGKNKKFKQIADIENSYIAADDIEIGYKNTIPLWLFGFLY